MSGGGYPPGGHSPPPGGYPPPGGHPPGGHPPGGYPPGYGYPPGGQPPGYGPPNAYQPPAYGYGVPPTPVSIVPGLMRERNGGIVILLLFLTCGIYRWFWLFNTCTELKGTTNDARINPGTDLLLAIVTCGIWAIFAEYRNYQIANAAIRWRYPQHEDKSQTILILAVLSLIIGITGLIALYLVQEEFNTLTRTANASPSLPA